MDLVIDARFLEPPEPFVRVMEALDLFDGPNAPESIRLLLFREPYPLYKVLDDYGYRRSIRLDEDGTFVIDIRPRVIA